MSEDLRAAAMSWWQEDPRRLESEQAAMHAVAPDLFWRYKDSGGVDRARPSLAFP